ncbi:DUF2793 domain-containing protein [Alkaliphilus sp. B6464]|uniref:DUF2793 domain-containing protein n=1 Tax=Alkaliphilus sp. B6464 TaxID=2731219 RepID=UPI001BAB0E98|nr:DUF2793 domain-containing protein [Alkaliphilus sp. B6464]QUH21411.1 DUF2793 domain-containing protein [Alkaliphilus sp. B6464]
MAQQTIKIRRGTKAQLNTLGTLSQGEMGFCTDTKEVYIGDGSKNIFVGKVLSGPYASRPNAGVEGRFFYVTEGANLGYIYIDNGSTWNRINSLALTDLTGNIDNIKDGATYAKVKKADITNGQVNKVSDGSKSATAAEIRDHIDDITRHRKINDTSIGATDLWSAQKINTEISNAVRGLDWQDSVGSKALTTPPVTPQKNFRWIIPTGATGAWAGKTNQIAHWDGAKWMYYTPSIGWSVYVHDENKNYVFNSTTWVRSGEANQNIKAGNGLQGGGQADEVTLSIGQGNGITVGTTSISVKAGKGITVDSTGVNASIDGSSIVYDGNKLTVALIDGGTF